jgi:glycine/D-amino acid oxidase-like deaminating enzyme/nitrite reductase/ring-hydroxylating ferredoxin subunit
MSNQIIDTTSLWLASARPPTYPTLDQDRRVDVVVIGGGIAGVTAAYLLKQAGKTVALLERRRCGQGQTGHTTAHLTAVTDADLGTLVDRLGVDHAQAVWDAGFAAIARIRANVRDERINCDFAWVQGCLHASPDKDLETARIDVGREAEVAAALGIDAAYVDEVPGVGRPGVVFEGQARFHPSAYLEVLASRIPGQGSYIFEETDVEGIESDGHGVTANGHRMSADYIVCTTHVPLQSVIGTRETLLQTDLFPYSTYAVRGIVKASGWPEGLFWEMASGPYEYLRVDRRESHDEVIFGGGDHKTGQEENTRAVFTAVEKRLQALIPDIQVTHRWSGQVLETRDGLPYIGEVRDGLFAATGFAGNGMTFGTLSGMMATDAVLGRANPWRELFDINRTTVLTGAWNYLRENKDYPYYMIRDRFTGAEGKTLRGVPRGEGRILDLDGVDVAAYRDEDGKVTTLSPVCTHMGCHVVWNTAEQSWDCPCHGSRFTPMGEVISGPAERPLDPVSEDAGARANPSASGSRPTR